MLQRNTTMIDQPPLPLPEFVALVAVTLALAALGIDTMLPALPALAQRLGVDAVRQAPLVLTVFVVGLGIGQLIYGPLTDRFGRRPVLIAGLGGYVVCNLAAGLAGASCCCSPRASSPGCRSRRAGS